MTPDCARRLLEAWRNHHRPARTIGAKIRDAVQHAHLSAVKKNAAIEAARNCHANRTPSPRSPHLR